MSEVPCFAAGTRILTSQGEIPVEKLSVGNIAISPTGSIAVITWLGSFEVDLKTSLSREDLSPIMIKRNALRDGVPHRDLYLSRDHALFIDGVLIPVRLLVNDISIVRADAFDFISYWHIELNKHGIVLAEGAAAESYIEWGNNRSSFTGFLGRPRQRRSAPAARYALRGDIVEAAHRRLLVRAEALHFSLAQRPTAQRSDERTVGQSVKLSS